MILRRSRLLGFMSHAKTLLGSVSMIASAFPNASVLDAAPIIFHLNDILTMLEVESSSSHAVSEFFFMNHDLVDVFASVPAALVLESRNVLFFARLVRPSWPNIEAASSADSTAMLRCRKRLCSGARSNSDAANSALFFLKTSRTSASTTRPLRSYFSCTSSAIASPYLRPN
jgi:hypothetical protein